MDSKKIKEKVKETIAYELMLAITNAKLELTEIVSLIITANKDDEKKYSERRQQLTNIIPILEKRLEILDGIK